MIVKRSKITYASALFLLLATIMHLFTFREQSLLVFSNIKIFQSIAFLLSITGVYQNYDRKINTILIVYNVLLLVLPVILLMSGWALSGQP